MSSHSIQLDTSGNVVAERQSGPARAVQIDRFGNSAAVTHNTMTQAGQDLAATETARQKVLALQEPSEPPAPKVPDASPEAPGDVPALPPEYISAAQTLGSIVEAHNIDLERVVGHVANTGSLPQQVQEQILAGFGGDASKANAALGQLEARVLSVLFDAADAIGVPQDQEAELFDYLGSPKIRPAYQKAWLNVLRSGDTSGVASLVRQFHQSSKSK